MTVQAESRFISVMIKNLNSNRCLSIDPLLDLARGSELNAVPPSLIMVGSSHAARLASTMPGSLPGFTCGGQQSGHMAFEAMALDIRDSVRDPPINCCSSAPALDNVAYHTFTTEDTIILCRKDQKVHCHIDGAFSCGRC
jgi:hypothetical protein